MDDVYEGKHRRADDERQSRWLRHALDARANRGSTHRRAAEELTVQ